MQSRVATEQEGYKVVSKLKLSLADITRVTGESEPTIRNAMIAGDLPTFLVGRRRFARPAAVSAWVDFLEAESNAGCPVCYRARPAKRLGDVE